MTTNYERIKNMTIEEMARLLIGWNGRGYICVALPVVYPPMVYPVWSDAYRGTEKWLRSECEDLL